MVRKLIVISGPSGSGKTTLAKALSAELGIPFIESSTKPLWRAWGISSHKEIITKSQVDPAWGISFQFAVLQHRKQLVERNPQMVTDRGPIDNWVYFLMQSSHHTPNAISERYLEECLDLHRQASCSFILEPLPTVEHDGFRVTNKYYAEMTFQLMKATARNFVELSPYNPKTVFILSPYLPQQRLQHALDIYLTTLDNQ